MSLFASTDRTVRSAIFVLCWTVAVASAAAAADDPSPYPDYPELYQQIRQAVESGDSAKTSIEAIDAKLAEVVISEDRRQVEHLSQLLVLREAAEKLTETDRTELALWLFDEPDKLARFFHALDESDDLARAVTILHELREVDSERFEDWFEFCIAYAVVWDEYRNHHWVKTPVDDQAMLDSYRFYMANERRLAMHPSKLPFELAVFVVGTHLRDSERQWILANYNARRLPRPTQMYASVPWTMALAPAHGKGLGMEYTLANIKQHGGCCMEQAYFTESVFRTLGVPAVYMRGEGRRGGHAWAGVLSVRGRAQWDVSSGRYTYDRYYQGHVTDPTAPRQTLSDSHIRLTASLFSARSLKPVEQAYFFTDAAEWVNHNASALPDGTDPAAVMINLLDQAVDACAYHARTWDLLASIAASGKMTEDQAIEWAKRLFETMARDCPDFFVMRLPALLEPVSDVKKKADIYDRAFGAFSRRRPDLAANVKIWEGDIWLEQDNVLKAVQSYMYPLVSFTKDDHVLDQARNRLAELDDKADPNALEDACKSIVRGLYGKDQTEQIEACNLALSKLANIYDSRDEPRKAAKMRSMIKPISDG